MKDDVVIYIKTDDSKVAPGVERAERKVNSLDGSFKKLTATFLGAFAVERVASTVIEMAKLSGEAEGVRAAFNKIANSGDLRKMQEATAGTVSELELMKQAVSANNLGVPVQNLAKLFEFATKRAQDTGQSVDYLTNSIVTGIGRKSPLILDNLGISAIQLKERLNGVSLEAASVADVAAAVGEIASESMRKSGEIIETNAIKIQSLQARYEDFKLSIAEDKSFKSFMSVLIDEAEDFLNLVTKFQTTEQVKAQKQLQKSWDDFADFMQQGVEDAKKSYEKIETPITTVKDRIKELEEKTKELQTTFKNPNISFEAATNAFQEAEKLKKELQVLQNILNFGKTHGTTSAKAIEGKTTPRIADKDRFNTGILPLETEKITDQAKAKVNAMYDEIQAEIDALNQRFTEAMVQGISGAFEAGFSGEGLKGILGAFLAPVASFLQQEGAMLVAHGLAMEAFKKSLETLNGIPAIIAGGAMIATAAAFRGFVSGGVSGSGAGYASGGSGGTGASNYRPTENRNPIAIHLTGELSAHGDSLKYVLDQTTYNDERTRG